MKGPNTLKTHKNAQIDENYGIKLFGLKLKKITF